MSDTDLPPLCRDWNGLPFVDLDVRHWAKVIWPKETGESDDAAEQS